MFKIFMVNNDSLSLIISPHKDGTKFSEQKNCGNLEIKETLFPKPKLLSY